MFDIIILDYIVSLAPYIENRRRFALPYCIATLFHVFVADSKLIAPLFYDCNRRENRRRQKKEKRDLTTSSRFRHNHRFLDLGRLVFGQ